MLQYMYSEYMLALRIILLISHYLVGQSIRLKRVCKRRRNRWHWYSTTQNLRTKDTLKTLGHGSYRTCGETATLPGTMCSLPALHRPRGTRRKPWCGERQPGWIRTKQRHWHWTAGNTFAVQSSRMVLAKSMRTALLSFPLEQVTC